MATRKTASKTAPSPATPAPPAQPVDALVHAGDGRLFIPSREEAGQEAEALAGRPTAKTVPLNPVTTRGQDPELYWMHKYGPGDDERALRIDIRSLYRHEHVEPERLIARLYALKAQAATQNDLFTAELHGNPLAIDELEKPASYYKRHDAWRNRLIQGDSLLVMTSLLEREGMAGQVQCIYIDPPYGIKYGSNWQMRQNDRNVKDGADDHLSGEPEVIKAFRDTWELGIHSYLSYLRDRLLVARELLSASGSCFVQISDENVHLVRSLMDEVFGSENFVSQIAFVKTSGQTPKMLASVFDHLIWYSTDKGACKYRQMFEEKPFVESLTERYVCVETPGGKLIDLSVAQKAGAAPMPEGRGLRLRDLTSQSGSENSRFIYSFQGSELRPTGGRGWSTNAAGLDRLKELGRLHLVGTSLRWKNYHDDFPFRAISNLWTDTGASGFGESRVYVVQTQTEVIKRCILMTTDPGDLVLDPTCGSGTTAHVAEQWGRRWITSDTSRIALNIAKTRLMTATYPWYLLEDNVGGDIRHGFQYKASEQVTLGVLAGDEVAEKRRMFDQALVDKKKLRVAGPFTVETLQGFEPLPPEALATAHARPADTQRFSDRVFEHLKHAGIKNGLKNETAVFNRVDAINEQMGDGGALHAEGWYPTPAGERKAYFHIGPQFGTVSKKAVNDAILACRRRADADWLVILGFGFESDVDNRSVTVKLGSFEVTKVRMHDDLMQDGLIKKDKKAASFVTIGEPDIATVPAKLPDGNPGVAVEIRGLDLYDPITDEVKPRNVADIAYWMVDEHYDGSNFVATQVFFCGGDHDEFDKWKKGLSALALADAKAKVEKTLKLELDDEAFERVYGHRSHPIAARKGQRVAVRVISQFGEESTKVLAL
ncbi:MAG: site-specific DNA-methyltransferase [Rubrivivax sp.]|nr:site-specific DNA-methyltransferase [Rubrivivax sp.]